MNDNNLTEQELKNLEMANLNNHMYGNDKDKMDPESENYYENYVPPFNEDGSIFDYDDTSDGNNVQVDIDNKYIVLEEIHTPSGLDAYIIENKFGELTLSIQGTGSTGDGLSDVGSDLGIVGGINPQTQELIDWLNEHPKYINEIDNVTGHSLGGGVGIDISVWLQTHGNNDFNAYIFDPAPFTIMDDDAMARLQGRVNITVFDEEFLSSWLNNIAVNMSHGISSLKETSVKVSDWINPKIKIEKEIEVPKAYNPADYFDINKIVDTGSGLVSEVVSKTVKGGEIGATVGAAFGPEGAALGAGVGTDVGIGVGAVSGFVESMVDDHSLNKIVCGAYDGTLDDLARISFSCEPLNVLDELKLYDEDEKINLIEELVYKKEEIEESMRGLEYAWEVIEGVISEVGPKQKRKFTQLHSKIMKYLKGITENENFEDYAKESSRLYDELNKMAKVQRYEDVKYEKGSDGDSINQILENSEYDFFESQKLKIEVMQNHNEVKAILEEIVEFGYENNLDVRHIEDGLKKVKESKQELDEIESKELDFQFNVYVDEHKADVDTDVVQGKKQQTIGDACLDYLDVCKDICDTIGELAHAIGHVEDAISYNVGTVFNSQYTTLEQIYDIFISDAQKCIENMNKFSQAVDKNNDVCAEVDASLGNGMNNHDKID